MKKRLYTIAAISAPIIAIYGSSPFYIFEKINLPTFLQLTFGLTLNVLLIFAINIYVVQRYQKLKPYWQFAITYCINICIRLAFLALDPILHIEEPSFALNYLSYPIITSFALTAIVQIIVRSIIIDHQKSEAEKQLQAMKLENTEAQKLVLMQQLQPHFLFNALSTLKSLIKTDASVAEAYVLKLSDFLRYSIQLNNEQTNSLDQEIQFAQDYIDLQKMRYGNAIEYTIDVPISQRQKHIPMLALQTLVENIFKHNQFTEKHKLHFSITCTEDALVVSNVKMPVKTSENNNTGLQNLDKRCMLICGKAITIEDTDSNFTVKIPLINQ
ncbi:MAG: hypothetical protein RL660_3126 [Bacteroidota bacterium]|jgi:sensor histidine kinase YesM